jgi:plastocyanin
MTQMSSVCKGWVKRGAVTVLALTLGFVVLRWLPLNAGDGAAGSQGAVTEVVLVARDMAFYRDGDFESANPPLRFAAGARVRLVLRNEEPGMKHNFAVPALDVATRDLNGEGVARVEFAVPDRKGRLAYECTPHSLMMRGTIEIR